MPVATAAGARAQLLDPDTATLGVSDPPGLRRLQTSRRHRSVASWLSLAGRRPWVFGGEEQGDGPNSYGSNVSQSLGRPSHTNRNQARRTSVLFHWPGWRGWKQLVGLGEGRAPRVTDKTSMKPATFGGS